MKRLLKYTLFTLAGVFALLGVGGCALALYLLVTGQFEADLRPHAHVGKDYTYSSAAAYLPVPQQTEEPFPMVVDCPASDGQSHILIFRASEAWQTAFRAFFTEAPNPMPGLLDTVQHHTAQLEDNRPYDFIAGRQWQPFHAGCIHEARRPLYFYALRDTSGEYLLIYFINY